jgi:hypothetical protein
MTGDQLLLLLVGLVHGVCAFACFRWTRFGANLILGGNLLLFVLVLCVAWLAQMLLLIELMDLVLTHWVPIAARRANGELTMAGFLAGIFLLQYVLVHRRKSRR